MGMFDPRYPVYILFFRRYVPFGRFGRVQPYTLGFGGYFEGDDRGVSTSLKATSRTYCTVYFNRFGPVYDFAASSGTAFHSVLFGVIRGMADVKHAVTRTTLTGPDLFEFEASSSGRDPLTPIAPNIDTFVKARVDFGSLNFLRISGQVRGDDFPNLEVFLVDPSRKTALLVDGRTDGGRNTGPLFHLWGSGSGVVLAGFNASLPLDKKGYFFGSSTCPITEISKNRIDPAYRR